MKFQKNKIGKIQIQYKISEKKLEQHPILHRYQREIVGFHFPITM